MANDLVIYQPPTRTREEKLAYIYEQVASGRSLYSLLNDPAETDLPSHATFWRWHMKDEDIRDNLARARETGVEALLEKAMHVAETPMEETSTETTVGANGVTRKVSYKEALGHRRLMVDTYLRRAQMIAPRKYAAKHSTVEGELVHRRPSEQLDPVTRATRLAALAGLIAGRLESGGDGGE